MSIYDFLRWQVKTMMAVGGGVINKKECLEALDLIDQYEKASVFGTLGSTIKGSHAFTPIQITKYMTPAVSVIELYACQICGKGQGDHNE